MSKDFCNVLAEQYVLASIVFGSEFVDKAIELGLNEHYFFFNRHKKIFKAILELIENKERVDFYTVVNKLPRNEYMKNGEYLLKISVAVPLLSKFKDYCEALIEAYKIRQLSNISEEITMESNTLKSDEIIKNLNNRIKEIEDACKFSKTESIQEVLIKMIDELENKDPNGVETGIKEFPKFYNSDLIFLAARPGVGKTSLALNIAANVARRHKVAFFSLEMSNLQLSYRLLSSDCGIPVRKFIERDLTQDNWMKLLISADSFHDYDLFISDVYNTTIDEIKSSIVALGGVKFAVIDYLQLVRSETQSFNKVDEVSEITRKLKMMAKELNIPILCLSQLSRASEQRNDHKPLLSDLRDSGSIEQDADVVMLLYRPYMYDKEASPNECECIVAKNRHDMTKTFSLEFNGELTRFN